MTTLIEWTDMTINPVVGCSHCSPGCDNCYAERFAARMAKHPNPKISGKYAGVVDGRGRWTGKMSRRYFIDAAFDSLPKAPKRVFVGSMCDIFHENMNYPAFLHFIKKLSTFSQHTFIVLTKRPKRMKKFVSITTQEDVAPHPWPLPNVWLGVTVCTQAEADEKIPLLLQTPAAKRFVSVEPMLGPVDLDKNEFLSPWRSQIDRDLPFIDWVICGGEAGPGARPMHPDWVRSLRDQCQSAGVPFFFKGWGDWVTENQAPEDIILPGESRIPKGWKGRKYEAGVYRVGKRRTGRLLDGRTWDEFPEVKV